MSPILLMLLALLTLTACNQKEVCIPEIRYETIEVLVPTKCQVERPICVITGNAAEKVVGISNCLIEYIEALKVCI